MALRVTRILVLVLSFCERALSFRAPRLFSPCTRPSTTSASSAASLSSPRSVRPSRRRAARATRYRVRGRAGAGVRLGRLRTGDEDAGAAQDADPAGSESDAALLTALLGPALL